jgi:hypothetical protein
LQNYPLLILELPPIQLHFAQTTLGFSIITKIPFLLTLLNFQKFHITHMSFTQTDTYFTLTNYVPSLQTHELSHEPWFGASVTSSVTWTESSDSPGSGSKINS